MRTSTGHELTLVDLNELALQCCSVTGLELAVDVFEYSTGAVELAVTDVGRARLRTLVIARTVEVGRESVRRLKSCQL